MGLKNNESCRRVHELGYSGCCQVGAFLVQFNLMELRLWFQDCPLVSLKAFQLPSSLGEKLGREMVLFNDR